MGETFILIFEACSAIPVVCMLSSKTRPLSWSGSAISTLSFLSLSVGLTFSELYVSSFFGIVLTMMWVFLLITKTTLD